MKRPASVFAAVAVALSLIGSARAAAIYDVEIVAEHPHDPAAFTQGLFVKDGLLFESTGLKGRSSLRRVNLQSGAVEKKVDLPADIFGEGIAPVGDRIVGLTWRSQIGYVFDMKSFATKRRFTYAGEGWGLTSDGKRLIMSDGTDELRFLNPSTLAETGRLSVTYGGKPLRNINELEWIDGEIYANVWRTDFIARIDPMSGVVKGVIDLSALRARLTDGPPDMDVANGIAWDTSARKLYVTGKNWPKLFEIKLKQRAATN